MFSSPPAEKLRRLLSGWPLRTRLIAAMVALLAVVCLVVSVVTVVALTRRSRDEGPPDVAHALRRVESESARMASLVEDLLLLARLDSGRPIEREPGRDRALSSRRA
jgi:signal transduction histidine kinase